MNSNTLELPEKLIVTKSTCGCDWNPSPNNLNQRIDIIIDEDFEFLYDGDGSQIVVV